MSNARTKGKNSKFPVETFVFRKGIDGMRMVEGIFRLCFGKFLEGSSFAG